MWVSGSRFNATPPFPDDPSGWALVEQEGPVQHVSDANNRFAGALYAMVASSSGTEALSAITFGGTTMSGCIVMVNEWSGETINISDWIRQSQGIDDPSTSDTTHGATLPGAAGDANNAIVFIDQLVAFANNNGTPKTGFTELQDAVYTGPDTRAAFSYRLTADDLAPTHTWSHANRHMGVVVELQPQQVANPEITSITPDEGTSAGGTAVTIAGTGFVDGATVTIGGAAATSVVFVDDTEITCVTPAGTVGAQDVVVTNPDTGTDTLTGGFTYLLTQVSYRVRIYDDDQETTLIYDSGVTASSTLSHTMPSDWDGEDAADYYIKVTVVDSNGATTDSALSSFTLDLPAPPDDPPPVIISIEPDNGPEQGETAVTITGTDFIDGATVTIGGNPATSVVVVSSSSITAVTPAGEVGAADVVVTNPDTDSDTLTGGFTYTQEPSNDPPTAASSKRHPWHPVHPKHPSVR